LTSWWVTLHHLHISRANVASFFLSRISSVAASIESAGRDFAKSLHGIGYALHRTLRTSSPAAITANANAAIQGPALTAGRSAARRRHHHQNHFGLPDLPEMECVLATVAQGAWMAAFAFAVIAAGEARAQSAMPGRTQCHAGLFANRDQPIQIEAATLEMRDKKKEATFAGNVKWCRVTPP